MSSLTAEALLDPKWAVWLNEPMDKFRTNEARLTAEIGPEETAKVRDMMAQKAAARLQAYAEYQENKRKAFAAIGAHPDANFNAVKAAYSRVTHQGLKKFLDQGEAKEAAIVAGARILGQDDPNPLPNLLKARPQLRSQVDQDPEAFGLYMAARHAYLKAAASRDQLAQEMGGDYEVAQERLRQMLQGAHQRLASLRGMLPTDSEEFALPPAPEAPRKGLVPRLQSAVASSVAPTLEKIAEVRGGDPAGVRGAIGAALPRPSAPTRALGVVPTNLQAVIEDFARYGLVEGPLFMAAGEAAGAAKIAPRVAENVGRGLVGRAVGRAVEGGAILGGVTAASPASSTDLKERAKETGAATVAGAVATPVLGAVGDVAGAGLKKLAKPKIEPRKTTRFGEDATAEFESEAVVPKKRKLTAEEFKRAFPQKASPEEALAKAETPAIQSSAPEAAAIKTSVPELNKTVSGTKAEIKKIREYTELDQIPEAQREPIIKALESAQAKKLDEKAADLARELSKSPRATTGEEHASLVLRLTKALDEYDAKVAEMVSLEGTGDYASAQMARSRAAVLQDEIDILTEGRQYASRETGRALNMLKLKINRETYDYAGVAQQARVAKGSKLTPEENAKFQKLVTALETKQKEFQDLELKYTASLAENERLAAQKIVMRASRKAQITTVSGARKSKLLEERAAIKQQLQSMGFRVNDITGVTSEGAYLVGRLAVNYIKMGATTLDEVVRLVVADIPSLSERDVHRALLTKDPSALAKQKSAIEKKIREIKYHASLIENVEKAEKGIFSYAESHPKRVYSDDIEGLRTRLATLKKEAGKKISDKARLERANRTIADLERQFNQLYRNVKQKKTPELPALTEAKGVVEEKRAAVKLQDRIIREEETLRTGQAPSPTTRPDRYAQSPLIKDLRGKLGTLKDKNAENRAVRNLQDRIMDMEEMIRTGNVRPPSVKRDRFAQSQRIQELRKTLTQVRQEAYKTVRDGERLEKAVRTVNDLQDQLTGMYRNLRKRKPPDNQAIASVKEKIASLRKEMRLEDEMADLQEQLRTGEFKLPAGRVAQKLPPHLEKKQIEVRLAKQQIRRAIEDQKPITPRKALGETVNTLRTLKATADMSSTLRQGLLLSAKRPVKAGKAFSKAFQATWSATKAEEIDAAMRSAPEHYLREKAGLYLPHVGDHNIGLREEMFMSRFIDKIKGLKQVVHASERHMITHLNLLRSAVFDDFVRKFPNATDTELKAWANYINVASGRGDLGKFAAIGNELGTAFFAPRFAVSRVQTPAMVFKYWKNPRVRAEIAKDYAAMAGVGATALGLADLAGLKVGTDPNDADWGKIVTGNTHIDLWGGFQQPMRLLTRVALLGAEKQGLVRKAKRSKYDDDPLEMLGRFAAYKLAPAITVPKELITHKDMMGNEVTPSETAVSAILPLVLDDVRQAYKEGSPEEAALVGGLSFFGVGANTYEKKKKKK